MNVIYENGWYELETDGIHNFRWSSPNSKIKIDTQLISKSISLQIGSPLENKLTVKTSKYQRDLYIKVGWHDYTIEFDDCIEFFSKPMDLQDDRKLSFMLGNLNLSDEMLTDNEMGIDGKDTYVIENVKSKWIDIIYILHASSKSNIEIHTNSDITKIPVFTGGERSISFKLKDEDIINNTVEFRVKKPTGVNFQIKNIINRQDFYDFFGLKKLMDSSSFQNLNRTKRIIENDGLIIQWFVTWKCNMSCTYCWQESASDVYRTIGGKTTKTPVEWANAINKLNPVQLYLTGGEPTLYSELPTLLNLLNSNIKIDMTSNFGKTFDLEKWKTVDFTNWKTIFFSFHPTQWTNPDDFFIKLEKFIKICDPFKVGIEMVLHPDNVKLVDPQKIIEFTKKHGLQPAHLDNFVDSAVSGFNLKSVPDEPIEIYKDEYKLNYKLENVTSNVNRTPIYCPAGWKKINIDFEGNIFTCMSAVDRSKLFHSTAMPHYSPIANIFENNFELQKEPILCWESFRCSACDYQMIQHAWTPFKTGFDYQLPIVE